MLLEDGQTSDLVMEAASGRIYHKPSGHLVSMADEVGNEGGTQTGENLAHGPPAADLGYEDEQQQQQDQETAVNTPRRKRGASSLIKTKPASSRKSTVVEQQREDDEEDDDDEVVEQAHGEDDEEDEQDELLQRLAESGDVLDLNTLFPGVTVTEVSPGVCLVTKPNGDRFNVGSYHYR